MEHESAQVAQAQQGNREAFAALVDVHKERVYHTLFRVTGNEADAQDLAQEVFLKVFRFLPTFGGGAAFATWLHRLTLNVAYDWLRGRRRALPQVPLDIPSGPKAGSAAASSTDTTVAAALSHERSEGVRQALQSLPPDYREVLVLRHLHQLGYQEIAERIRAPVRTVETRLYRARALLRTALAGLEGGDGLAVSGQPTAVGRLSGR